MGLSVVVCSSSSLSFPHVCITPRSPLLSLNFSLLHSAEQASTDVVQIPPRGALVRPAVRADVEGRGERREARLPQLPQAGARTCRGRDEGEGAVESPGRRDGLREAAREQEGVRHRLHCCQGTKRESHQSQTVKQFLHDVSCLQRHMGKTTRASFINIHILISPNYFP